MWLERILELRSNYGKVLVYGASGDQGVPLVNTLIKKDIKLELLQDIQKIIIVK